MASPLAHDRRNRCGWGVDFPLTQCVTERCNDENDVPLIGLHLHLIVTAALVFRVWCDVPEKKAESAVNHPNTWIILASMTCFLSFSILNAEEPAGLHSSGIEIVVNLDTDIGEMYNFWNVYPVTDQSPFVDEQQFDRLKQKHYDYTVAAVQSALPDADIGPGNVVAPMKGRKQKSWAPAIINHCANGANHVSGQTGTPLAFFGSSYYTSVGRTDQQFDKVVEFLRGKLHNHPQFAGVPVEIQEFGILSEGGKWIVGDGTEFGGSWLAHMADKIYRNRVRRVFQWSWNTNKGGDLPIPLTHVMDMLEKMAGGTRLSVETSHTSEEDHIGCIAAKKDDRVDLIVFRHLSVRANGEKAPVRLTLDGDGLGKKNWTVTRVNLLDGEHAGFMGERNADMQQARAKSGDEANAYAIALEVMASHRAKYEKMSKLHSPDPLPTPTIDSSGRMHFDLTMDGHAVVFLQLK